MKKYILSLLALALSVAACKDPYLGQMFELDDGDDTKITNIAYLEKHMEDYSLFLDFLQAADYYNALNDASTIVTLMAPDNEAMETFMQERNITSFEQLDSLYARQIIQTHMIEGSINEASFIQYLTEGSISMPTVFGDYLSLSYGFINRDVDDDMLAQSSYEDTLNIYINNQSKVKELDHQTVNGRVYKVGSVIIPLVESVVDKLELSGEHNIMVQAIEETGLREMLEKTADTIPQLDGSYTVNQIRYTILAVTDKQYREQGINDLPSLCNYLKATDEAGKIDVPMSDSSHVLFRYINYHILSGAYTKEELVYTAVDGDKKVLDSGLANEIITIQTLDGISMLNRGSEDSCAFVRSNIPACNGYIHRIGSVLPVWCPEPTVVIWDFCNSSDIISIVNTYGAKNNLGNLFSSPVDNSEYQIDLSSTSEYGTANSFIYKKTSPKSKKQTVGFLKTKMNTDETLPYENTLNAYMNNLMTLNLGYSGYIEFKTPTLVKGRYRVEIFYAGAKPLATKFYGGGSAVKFNLDDFSKQVYMWKGWDKNDHTVKSDCIFESLIFEGTNSHTLRATFMDVNASSYANYNHLWDYIKFTPILD